MNFVANLVTLWVQSGRIVGLLPAAAFGYLLFNGVRGAFDYAELDRELREFPEAGR
ncbi:MAG TPA: hypothetical protein VKA84_05505 [Gemmatimonadaceae bacterium]|nr:hypothetical protein [Gemmatimonadaceae bacterium]